MIVAAFACYGKQVNKEAVFTEVEQCVSRERDLKTRRLRIKQAYQQLFKKMFGLHKSLDIDSDSKFVNISRNDELKGWEYIPNIHNIVTAGTAYEYFINNTEIRSRAMKMILKYIRKFVDDRSMMILIEDVSHPLELEALNEFNTLTIFIDSRANARSPSLYNTVNNKVHLYGKTAYVTVVKGEPYRPVVKKRLTDFLFTIPSNQCLPIVHITKDERGNRFDRKICTGNKVRNICRHYNGPDGCLNFLATNKDATIMTPPRFKENWKCYEETSSQSLRHKPLLVSMPMTL